MNDRLHIGFLTSEYPHEKAQHAAGIGTSIKNLVNALRGQDIAVSVFVFGQQHDEVLVEDGIKIHLIAQRSYRLATWYQYRKFLQQYLNRVIAADKIDLIEAPDWTGITAFMKINAPLVVRFHGSDAYFCHLEHRKQKMKNFVFEKLGIGKADAYIAPTDFAGKISQYIFKIKNKPIQTIHYGLSLEQFQNPEPAQYTKGLILYIGTIIRKKGVLELPAIFEKVLADFPEAQLVLIGGDSFDLSTQSTSTWRLLQHQLSKNAQSKVSYLGKVPYREIQDYIKRANVCVFPTFAETLGMVTIESMAMQKAVVNSNIGWAPELIDDGVNGYLVHPENHDLYAQRILELLGDNALCQTIGSAARRKTEQKFDIQQLVRDNIAFYRQVIKDKK